MNLAVSLLFTSSAGTFILADSDSMSSFFSWAAASWGQEGVRREARVRREQSAGIRHFQESKNQEGIRKHETQELPEIRTRLKRKLKLKEELINQLYC